MSKLIDRFGRVHDYLRISVTDQCNLRCLYCMPEEGMEFMDKSKLMTAEELHAIVTVAAKLGIRKIRITGGEPLVRKDIVDIVRSVASVPGIEDVSLTTNGLFLAPKAEELRAAGLRRVNISLDTLDSEKFVKIARRGDLTKVMDGIRAASRAGLAPIKLNCVLLKGLNESEIADFLQMSIDEPLHIRFIEYMPIGHADEGWRSLYLPLTKVMEIADRMPLDYAPLADMKGNGPSEDWQFRGAKGSFGLIHPISDRFCANCNRLRLTADGHLKPCLYWVDELNVKPFAYDEEALTQLFYKAMNIKPENHEMAEKLSGEVLTHVPTDRRMSQIGG
ncbi:GTP 3',8-cyclase MoaA [Paenibacillus thermotolerans]|uniref:GTP 3',8-cyclase MoaA n=1 Tax=Paenibacillus thermotolerans TaxID=3027807 RepID=UPI00236896D6|nr:MULTISPECIES: GTP 3',8-cyclase MoaA [unclassified Paenibacillus]